MSSAVLVTVAVVVRADKRLYRLLSSLESQTISSADFEIVVVENGSRMHDDVVELHPSVRYFWLPEANLAKARNAALQVARGKYYLMTDADCVAEFDWVEKMLSALVNAAYVGMGGSISKIHQGNWVQKNAITIVDGQNGLNYLPALHLPYVVGANCGFLRSALLEVGGFDEHLISGSDVDICYKLGLLRMYIGHVASARVYHEDRSTVVEHFNRFRRYAVYQVLLFAKYKKHSGKKFVLNEYPVKRFLSALRGAPQAAMKLLSGDPAPMQTCWLQVVEALGIWCGDLQGSLRFRQIYI